VAVQLKRNPLPYDTISEGSYRYSNGYAPAVPLVVLEPPCTNFMEVKSVLDIGRTVIDVESVPISLIIIILL
jgi:hypothetical protein